MDSNDEFEEGGFFISCSWFSKIHNVMERRASVTPPAVLDTSSTITEAKRVHTDMQVRPLAQHVAGDTAVSTYVV